MKIFNVIKIGGNHVDFTIRANSLQSAESILENHVENMLEYDIEQTNGATKDEMGRPYPEGIKVNN